MKERKDTDRRKREVRERLCVALTFHSTSRYSSSGREGNVEGEEEGDGDGKLLFCLPCKLP